MQRQVGSGAPRFYLTGRQPIRPEVLVLAVLLAAATLVLIAVGLAHSRRAGLLGESRQAGRSGSAAADDDDKDDPNQVDTIVLSDPTEAPQPVAAAHTAEHHAGTVHPTILVQLPRTGPETGMIPNTDAGRLLYSWLAAFNKADPLALAQALPSAEPGRSVAAQMELRQETRGFSLLSAKEVEPGVVVFRLLSHATPGREALGALVIHADSVPPTIASFSLRSVPMPATPGPPGASATDEH